VTTLLPDLRPEDMVIPRGVINSGPTFHVDTWTGRTVRQSVYPSGISEAVIDGELMITEGIFDPVESPPRDVIPVNDFPVLHYADLCVCLHSRLQHYSKLGQSNGEATRISDLGTAWWGEARQRRGGVTDGCTGTNVNGDPCTCTALNPVSPKVSKHVYHRGQKTVRKTLASLYPGDRVLTGWTGLAGKVRLTENKRGAMVSVVKAAPRPYREGSEGQSWRDRGFVVATDLGESVAQPGGTPVLVVH
jgi:hypothetical protein